MVLVSNQSNSYSLAISPSIDPLREDRQIKGVQTVRLIYAALVTLLTIRVPCSEDQSQDDLSKKTDSSPPCQGDFLLAQQQQRTYISDHAVQCVPQAFFVLTTNTAASSAFIFASVPL